MFQKKSSWVGALALVLAAGDAFAQASPFSAGAGAGFEPLGIDEQSVQLPLRIYSTAGTLELPFLETTRVLLAAFADAGAETVLVERVAGHDSAQWLTTFAEAAPWAFPPQPAD